MCRIISFNILSALISFKHLWDKVLYITDRIYFLPLCYRFNIHPIQSDFIKVFVVVVLGGCVCISALVDTGILTMWQCSPVSKVNPYNNKYLSTACHSTLTTFGLLPTTAMV